MRSLDVGKNRARGRGIRNTLFRRQIAGRAFQGVAEALHNLTVEIHRKALHHILPNQLSHDDALRIEPFGEFDNDFPEEFLTDTPHRGFHEGVEHLLVAAIGLDAFPQRGEFAHGIVVGEGAFVIHCISCSA